MPYAACPHDDPSGYCLRCMVRDVGECEDKACTSIVRPFRHLHVAGVTIQLKRNGDGLDFAHSTDRHAFVKALQGCA